jgi:hypothetical protein
MNRKILLLILLLAVAALAAGLLFARPPKEAGVLRPKDPAIVARGQAVYADCCASCHGADVAIESAGFTLVKGNLDGIVRARRLSRATMRNIKQNLFFALIYNAAGVPIAAGILYPFFGILVGPIIAAFAMSASSVSVVSNALRLRSVKI